MLSRSSLLTALCLAFGLVGAATVVPWNRRAVEAQNFEQALALAATDEQALWLLDRDVQAAIAALRKRGDQTALRLLEAWAKLAR